VLASLKKIFKKDPIGTANVDEVVALGAALYALNKASEFDIELDPILGATAAAMKVKDVAPRYFGVISIGHRASRQMDMLQNSILIKKGQSIPYSITEDFFTTYDNQTGVSCTVTECQTAETDPTFVKQIWEGGLEVPGGRPAGQKIKVTFAYSEDGMLSCTYRDDASGKSTDVELDLASGNVGTAKSEPVEKFQVD